MTGAVKDIEATVRAHPFFADLDPAFGRLVSGCARNAHFQAGEYLFHEGDPADQFFLIREGRVSLEVRAPGRGATTFQTLGPGEIVGVSWLVAPYRWSYDAKAADYTRVIAMDAACLRGKCDADHDLGYELMTRFMPVLIQRLQATRMQILDVYGEHA
ncbi:cyclic nucleotide-binding domain-containing protein [Phenylobacterium sp.]|uniref:cyclic nucleotide-binding domain-containing protein n=1 Tax=Phenylobacterium sp. TaxID=1871053 RepID=UPI0035B1886C